MTMMCLTYTYVCVSVIPYIFVCMINFDQSVSCVRFRASLKYMQNGNHIRIRVWTQNAEGNGKLMEKSADYILL